MTELFAVCVCFLVAGYLDDGVVGCLCLLPSCRICR